MSSKRKVVSLLSHKRTVNVCEDSSEHTVHDDSSSSSDVLELLISCSDLANLDVFSKTDPMCVIFIKQFGQWKELGRTEAVRDQLNPKFTETFVLECDREISQPLLFSVYDIDSRSTDLRKHDHVGSVEVNVQNLLPPGKKLFTTSCSLRVPGDPQSRGWIHITAEVMRPCRSALQLHLGATKLDKTGLFSTTKTDTYVELCRSVNSIEFHPVYRTEVVFKSQNPRWRPFEIRVQKLCNNDLDRPIMFRCCHINKEKDAVTIGEATVTLKELITKSGKSHTHLPLSHPKKARKKKKYKDSGQLRVIKCNYDSQSSVLDYVKGGCSIKFAIAIDFTSSNGHYKESSSLHHLDGVTDNQYVEAMKSLGAMLSQYDLEQDFIMLGFGAKNSSGKKMKSFIDLRRGASDTRGIQGLLECYKALVPKLKFSGPTRLAPVISEVVRRVASSDVITQQSQRYHVLLIITDGVINDIEATIDAVIDSSSLPLSIILAGIGPSDFSSMDVFENSSQSPLKSLTSSKTAARDNVHFIAIRKQKYSTGANTALAREAMAAISKHFLAYMKSLKISPNRPKHHKRDATVNGWVGDDGAWSGDTDLNPTVCLTGIHRNLDVPSTYSDANNQLNTASTAVKMLSLQDSTGPTCPTCGGYLGSRSNSVIDLSLSKHDMSSLSTLQLKGLHKSSPCLSK